MKRGLLVGEVWASRKVEALAGRSLKLVVETANSDAGQAGDATPLHYGELVVAIDTLDGRLGQQVLLAYGSGARNVIKPGPDNRAILADAAVALLLDSE
jgi:microcompartment protein CcmK/EutM